MIFLKKTASCFVNDVWSALLVPIVNICILICFWVLFIVGLIYVYSIGEIEKNDTTSFSTVKWESLY